MKHSNNATSNASAHQPKHMRSAQAEPANSATTTASRSNIGRSTRMMSVLVILSRLTGFLRTWAQRSPWARPSSRAATRFRTTCSHSCTALLPAADRYRVHARLRPGAQARRARERQRLRLQPPEHRRARTRRDRRALHHLRSAARMAAIVQRDQRLRCRPRSMVLPHLRRRVPALPAFGHLHRHQQR